MILKKIKQPRNGLFKIMSKMPVNSTHSSPLEITKKRFKLMVIQTEKYNKIGRFWRAQKHLCSPIISKGTNYYNQKLFGN